MEGKIIITVTDGKINVDGELRNANKVGGMAIVHSLLQALGFSGAEMLDALMLIGGVEMEIEKAKAENPDDKAFKSAEDAFFKDAIENMKGGTKNEG
jgi:hypothetical protein